jgi:hypothetical protein
MMAQGEATMFRLHWRSSCKCALYITDSNCSICRPVGRKHLFHIVWKINFRCRIMDRICGLVARVPGYISRGPSSIPYSTRFFSEIVGLENHLCGQWTDFLATDPEFMVRFPALPDFLRSSWSGVQ